MIRSLLFSAVNPWSCVGPSFSGCFSGCGCRGLHLVCASGPFRLTLCAVCSRVCTCGQCRLPEADYHPHHSPLFLPVSPPVWKLCGHPLDCLTAEACRTLLSSHPSVLLILPPSSWSFIFPPLFCKAMEKEGARGSGGGAEI